MNIAPSMIDLAVDGQCDTALAHHYYRRRHFVVHRQDRFNLGAAERELGTADPLNRGRFREQEADKASTSSHHANAAGVRDKAERRGFERGGLPQ
jgi:hypothetical protein